MINLALIHTIFDQIDEVANRYINHCDARDLTNEEKAELFTLMSEHYGQLADSLSPETDDIGEATEMVQPDANPVGNKWDAVVEACDAGNDLITVTGRYSGGSLRHDQIYVSEWRLVPALSAPAVEVAAKEVSVEKSIG